MAKILFLVLVLGLLAAPLSARAANLELTITGVRSDTGEVLIGVYDRADAFASAIDGSATKSALLPQTWRIVGVSLRAKTGSQSIIFTQLPPGRYAVIAFHDENDNGLLDANGFGIPIEGYGFSNDARGFLSAPSFDAAAIAIGRADLSIDIALKYPRDVSSGDQLEFDRYTGTSRPTK